MQQRGNQETLLHSIFSVVYTAHYDIDNNIITLYLAAVLDYISHFDIMTMTTASKICRLSNTSNKSLIHLLYILLWARLPQLALPNAHCADCAVQKLRKCNMI